MKKNKIFLKGKNIHGEIFKIKLSKIDLKKTEFSFKKDENNEKECNKIGGKYGKKNK